MKAVILAAGYAVRLKSVTNNGKIAKPLLEISAEGKTQPILYFLLDKIYKTNVFDEVIVVTNNKYYKQFCSSTRTYQTMGRAKSPITVLNDGTNSSEEAKGANGDLRIANSHIPFDYQEEVLVVAGDNYFDFGVDDLIEFYDTVKRENLLNSLNVVVSKVYPESQKEEIANKFGILDVADGNRVVGLDEKPGIENIKSTNVCLATYLFDRQDFDLIDRYIRENENDKKKRDSLGYFVNYIIKNTVTYTYPFRGTFIDIGSPDDYYQLQGNPKRV